jgi:hypothetical protein
VSCLLALFPLPHLGYQVSPSVPTRNGGHTFIHMLPSRSHHLGCLCPPSPPCVYCDPGFPWETHTIVSYDFLELLLHLVCHAPWSIRVLSQLQGASQGKSTTRNSGLGGRPCGGKDPCRPHAPQAHPNPTPGAQSSLQLRQSRGRSQVSLRVTTTTPPKRDEKGNECAHVRELEEELWASGADQQGVRTDMGLCVTHTP